MENIIRFLEDNNKKLYVTERGCELINHAQEMIARERMVIWDERKVIVPGCQLQLVDGTDINAFVTKIDGEYCIFVNKGIIEEQKLYLEELDWSFIPGGVQRAEYIDIMIEYGFYFSVFHEYAHIFCGHVDAELSDPTDKKAQECEADMFAMDYMIKYIEYNNEIGDYVTELEKLFLAVYFLFERKQKQNEEELYDNKLIQNYYDNDRIKKRNHPLDAQRILYLYEMLNIFIVTDKVRMLPVKEKILEKLRILKRLTDVDLPKNELAYLNVDKSVQDLKKTLKDIREKIPRGNKNIEDAEKM